MLLSVSSRKTSASVLIRHPIMEKRAVSLGNGITPPLRPSTREIGLKKWLAESPAAKTSNKMIN